MDSFVGALNKFASGQGQGGQNNHQQQAQQYGQQSGQQQQHGFAQDEQYPTQPQQHQQQQGQQQGFGGLLGGLTNKLNAAAGGGPESEKNEDYLDKAVDFAQERFLGQGPQNNESAVEQAKDEQISDFIRKQYKSTMGSDIPIKDKPTTFEDRMN